MDIDERNQALAAAFAGGEPMTSISNRSGVSCSQLSRIFRAIGVKRPKYELDIDYFEKNKDKTTRQISETTGVPIKRVNHLRRIAYGKKPTKGQTDFTGTVPSVDPKMLDDYNWMYEQYITNNLGTPTIARLTASKATDVAKKLKALGIKLKTVKEAMQKFEKRPARAWLEEHYQELEWSITKCANEFGTGFSAIYTALREHNFKIRDASEQHIGELNEFYGKQHDPDVAAYCAEIGTRYGREYWLTGDVADKIRQVSERAREIWADPGKRAEQSARLAELCARGGCNSKQIMYVRQRDGRAFVFRSSWEHAIALWLESCSLVKDWDFEALSIPYDDDGQLRNFVIDFKVEWVSGLTTYIECKNKFLLGQEKEVNKIAAAVKFLRYRRSNLVVVSDLADIRNSFSEPDYLQWLSGKRYAIATDYLNETDLYREALRHHLVSKLIGWQSLQYSAAELADDLNNLRAEDPTKYSQPSWRSSVPSAKGMAGRRTVIQFQPHFLSVPIWGMKPVSAAFDGPWPIYRGLLQSMEERESLSLERLLREITFHFAGEYARTSHFAPGLARAMIREMGASGKRIFDPCCGWGGRLLGAWLEGCSYSGCELSTETYRGLTALAGCVGAVVSIVNKSCLDHDWPECDLIVTSPPFFDIEEYIGGDQPWLKYESRDEWLRLFVQPFVEKIGATPAIIHLDDRTRQDFDSIREFDKVIAIEHQRHARRRKESEFLCVYQ